MLSHLVISFFLVISSLVQAVPKPSISASPSLLTPHQHASGLQRRTSIPEYRAHFRQQGLSRISFLPIDLSNPVRINVDTEPFQAESGRRYVLLVSSTVQPFLATLWYGRDLTRPRLSTDWIAGPSQVFMGNPGDSASYIGFEMPGRGVGGQAAVAILTVGFYDFGARGSMELWEYEPPGSGAGQRGQPPGPR